MANILIIEDDEVFSELLVMYLEDRGYEPLTARTLAQARQSLDGTAPDAILLDQQLPDGFGLDFLKDIAAQPPFPPVIMITGASDNTLAIEAMQHGAYDFIRKPMDEVELETTLFNALRNHRLSRQVSAITDTEDYKVDLGQIVGNSPAVLAICKTIGSVAASSAPVLITGESGTGKELVARALHFHGATADKPFVPINCTALPEGLLESELFGHVRGAFTGAHSSKAGLFKEADGGTIFLDEIGDMSLGLQAKLLRVIQDREIRPVGSTQSFKVNVRIVAATNQNLLEAAENKCFREDLFYRLNVIPIEIPPIRERREDIPPLIKTFLVKHAEGEPRYFSDEAMEAVCAQQWKGNAREVENVVERALAFSDSPELGLKDLGLGYESCDPESGSQLMLDEAARQHMSLHDLQEQYMDQVLELTNGNKVQAAKILQIDRKTLYRRQLRSVASAH
jgi:DNA-binding NtrC family response regulator